MNYQVPPPFDLAAARISGESHAIQTLRCTLSRHAKTSLPVMIRGETGSGKEVCARALHAQSAVSNGPFVAINCAAIPATLILAELFGSVEGAFTGARQRSGLIAAAHRGTLFLDELGELSLESQAALLRVLERREVIPVGGVKARRVEFRLISATHQPLEELIRQRRFREDLYHRISTLPLWIPPLREREGDLPRLVNEFAPELAPRLSRSAWRALQMHSWPGNLRELRNVLLRINAEQPEGWIDGPALRLSPPSREEAPRHWTGRTLREQSDLYILDAIRAHDGNLRATARGLSVSVNTIYRALQRLRDHFEGTTEPPPSDLRGKVSALL